MYTVIYIVIFLNIRV